MPSLADARAFCRKLARSHYENFTVASLLLPRDLRPHFHAVYAYCRWADDLADESGSAAESLRLLDNWEAELDACYAGRPQHPIFVALADTVRTFDIPAEPFRDLLTTFRQDQSTTHYRSAAEVEAYCRNSANPVGRLVLYLARCHTPQAVELSDTICTGLQLANFCQDVRRDYEKGRIYLPEETLIASSIDPEDLPSAGRSGALAGAVTIETARARRHLEAGWPLVELVPRPLQLDIRLFIEGGLAIVGQIERAGYNVWSRRPTVSKFAKLRLLLRSLLRSRRGGTGVASGTREALAQSTAPTASGNNDPELF